MSKIYKAGLKKYQAFRKFQYVATCFMLTLYFTISLGMIAVTIKHGRVAVQAILANTSAPPGTKSPSSSPHQACVAKACAAIKLKVHLLYYTHDVKIILMQKDANTIYVESGKDALKKAIQEKIYR